jgi:hypothetical protein
MESPEIAQGADGAGGGLSQQQQLAIGTTDFGLSFSTPFQRGTASALSYVGRILANDVHAAAVGVAAKPFVFANDLIKLGSAIWSLDAQAIGVRTFATIYDALIPTYGYYGGAGWGLDTFPLGQSGNPLPLNSVDWASFLHDSNLRNLQWLRNVWSPTVRSLPPGPLPAPSVSLMRHLEQCRSASRAYFSDSGAVERSLGPHRGLRYRLLSLVHRNLLSQARKYHPICNNE